MKGNSQGPLMSNRYGHLMTKLAPPTKDSDGEMTSYAMCSQCGAVENSDESIKDCPKK